MTKSINIYEVGPRDGLQNETVIIPTRTKIAMIDALSRTGLTAIEATSFVSPRWVPQMADAAEIMAGIARKPGVRYAALVPNRHGFDAAVEAGVNEVAIFASASEGFSRKNINCSVAESLERFTPVMTEAENSNIPVRGYVSCVIACPYDGRIAPELARDVASRLLDMGCYEISLGDTIGAGQPDDIARLLDAIVPSIPSARLAGHFHDTGGRAIANVERALDFGIACFDSAVGGLGGCPYAPGAKGNLATRLLVERLLQLGYETGINLEALTEAEQFVTGIRTAPKEISP